MGDAVESTTTVAKLPVIPTWVFAIPWPRAFEELASRPGVALEPFFV
jgi:hypothetical protein